MAGRKAFCDREEIRKNQIVVPMREDEKKRIIDAAKKADMSMSAYVRWVLKSHFRSKEFD